MIGARRKRHGSASSSIVHAMPQIRGGLVAAVLGAEYGKAPSRRPVRQFNGKHPVVQRKSDVPDELILEIRRLHEQEGKTTAEIHKAVTDLGHALTKAWVYKCTQYHNRSYLVPAAGAQPYLKGTP